MSVMKVSADETALDSETGEGDFVGALLKLAAMGPEVAEIICTAATATLMTECEARAQERRAKQ